MGEGNVRKKDRSRVSALRVGSGIEPGVQIGPLIDQPALAKVERHLAEMRQPPAIDR